VAGCTQNTSERSFLKGVAGFVPANYLNLI